jgi:hypothetical protein
MDRNGSRCRYGICAPASRLQRSYQIAPRMEATQQLSRHDACAPASRLQRSYQIAPRMEATQQLSRYDACAIAATGKTSPPWWRHGQQPAAAVKREFQFSVMSADS